MEHEIQIIDDSIKLFDTLLEEMPNQYYLAKVISFLKENKLETEDKIFNIYKNNPGKLMMYICYLLKIAFSKFSDGKFTAVCSSSYTDFFKHSDNKKIEISNVEDDDRQCYIYIIPSNFYDNFPSFPDMNKYKIGIDEIFEIEKPAIRYLQKYFKEFYDEFNMKYGTEISISIENNDIILIQIEL